MSLIRKWFTSLVLPGVADVFASPRLLHNILIREDLPTLERPMNANSGSFGPGFWEIRVLLPANRASEIFILSSLKGGAKIHNFG